MQNLKRKFERAALLLFSAVILCGGAYAAIRGNRTSIPAASRELPPVTVQVIEPTYFQADKLPDIQAEPLASVPPTPSSSRYAGITLSEEDVETLARLVWLEARGEPFEGQVAVVEVVLNRILSDRFPDQDDVQTVVFAEGQFSPARYIWSDTTTPTGQQYDAVWTAYEALEPVTELDVVYFSTEPQNDRIFKIIGGHYFCRV